MCPSYTCHDGKVSDKKIAVKKIINNKYKTEYALKTLFFTHLKKRYR